MYFRGERKKKNQLEFFFLIPDSGSGNPEMRKEDIEKVESVISKALESKPHEIRKTYRLGKKSDHGDLIKDYGRPVPQLCLAFMWVTDFIYETHQHLVTSLDQPWLLPQHLGGHLQMLSIRKEEH